MPTCPYCTTEIIDEINFCIECEKQVKCIKCGTLLYENKSRCLKCGESLDVSSVPQTTMNTYSLEEKTTKSSSYRRIEAQVSDNAVGVLMAKFPFGLNTPLQPLNNQDVSTENSPLALPNNSDKVIVGPEDTSFNNKREETIASDSIEIDTLFIEHSDHGIIPSETLRDHIQKLPTKKDKQQTFAIMFVWAYQQRLKESISHENLVNVMKFEDLFDANSSKYLKEIAKNYFKTGNNDYEINKYDGMQQVSNILESIKNPQIIETSSEAKKRAQRNRTSTKSKAEIDQVKPWLERPIEGLDNFDSRTLKTASQWGMFGLYILTKVLKVQEAVEASVVYTFLTQKYPTISVKRSTFLDKMCRRTNKRVSRNLRGTYFLTQDGEMEIKKLIESSKNK